MTADRTTKETTYASGLKIVLTGGPAAGKTSIINILERNDWDHLVTVPEAASILFQGGFPRDRDPVSVRCQQRAIYHVQKELEEISYLRSSHRNLLCDRGSLDGLAYWPGDEASFFHAMRTTMEAEVARYHWVIHLDTAPPGDYQTTAIRKETREEALAINQKVRDAWRHHPQRVIIPDAVDFLSKTKIAADTVMWALEGLSFAEVSRRVQDELNNNVHF